MARQENNQKRRRNVRNGNNQQNGNNRTNNRNNNKCINNSNNNRGGRRDNNLNNRNNNNQGGNSPRFQRNNSNNNGNNGNQGGSSISNFGGFVGLANNDSSFAASLLNSQGFNHAADIIKGAKNVKGGRKVGRKGRRNQDRYQSSKEWTIEEIEAAHEMEVESKGNKNDESLQLMTLLNRQFRRFLKGQKNVKGGRKFGRKGRRNQDRYQSSKEWIIEEIEAAHEMEVESKGNKNYEFVEFRVKRDEFVKLCGTAHTECNENKDWTTCTFQVKGIRPDMTSFRAIDIVQPMARELVVFSPINVPPVNLSGSSSSSGAN